MEWNGLYLGAPIDPETSARGPDIVDFDPDDLTTHGVIVGMTGSGKTGLGVIYIEEALRRGIPVLVLDPKGDMTNLLLTFPELLPADFEPWMDDVDARRRGKSIPEVAAETAALWSKGLDGWGLGGTDIRSLRDAAEFTIYTPGSRIGVPLNLIGSLRRPNIDWDTDGEALRDEIQGFVSGLFEMIGVQADPISSREHILMSNLIEHAWRSDVELDLEKLLAWVQHPPLRKLGVFDVDSFFPADERRALALRVNSLIASPSFSDWMEGDDLDPGRLLWADDGRPRAAILYLAHLSDEERQFVVTLALSRLVTWMRQQPGTGGLRALVYLDEAFGFAPPVGEPPAKKPILTILKQARAFGVGMLVSTQNPMDLDYKAMSNAGTWNIGRLQTERDKARILEGLGSASGEISVDVFDKLISGLGKREFVLHSTRNASPAVFTTRWAMSYLRGPLTRPQIKMLTGDRAHESPERSRSAERHEVELKDDETRVMPPIADRVRVRFAVPSAPWSEAVGLQPDSRRYRAAAVATVDLRYDDTRAGVDHREEWEAIVPHLTDPFDAASAIAVDHEPRDFTSEAPDGAIFVLPEAAIDGRSYFRSAEAALKDHLDSTRAISILRNRALGLYSRPGESREEFEARCDRGADDGADDAAAKLRDKYETKLARARDRFEAADRRAEEIEVDLEGAKRTEWTDLAGTVIDFLGGRRSARRMGGTARRRASVRSKEQRLRTARERAEDRQEEIEDLDEELLEELEDLAEEWDRKAVDIDEIEIGLERTDIQVKEIFVAWIPV